MIGLFNSIFLIKPVKIIFYDVLFVESIKGDYRFAWFFKEINKLHEFFYFVVLAFGEIPGYSFAKP